MAKIISTRLCTEEAELFEREMAKLEIRFESDMIKYCIRKALGYDVEGEKPVKPTFKIVKREEVQ